jgi:Recombination, repair and ssDNA binding protein UvsY
VHLDDILLEWKTDSRINRVKLEEECINAPMLHGKYLEHWVNAKAQLKMAEQRMAKLGKEKWLYYEGKMSEEDIKRLNLEPDPFNGLKVMKGDRKHWYESDEDLLAADAKIDYYKLKIDTLAGIIDMLKWRSNTIKNIIDIRRFESGN